jgi:hypothetical protein
MDFFPEKKPQKSLRVLTPDDKFLLSYRLLNPQYNSLITGCVFITWSVLWGALYRTVISVRLYPIWNRDFIDSYKYQFAKVFSSTTDLCIIIIIIIIIIITNAIGFSPNGSGSGPYSITDKANKNK